jgi:hypothetical protein
MYETAKNAQQKYQPKLDKKNKTERNIRAVQLITTYPLADGACYVPSNTCLPLATGPTLCGLINKELNPRLTANYAAEFD